MNSSVPYLLRAIVEWIVDNDCTPYLIVDAEVEGTIVPREFIKDGQIVLNISAMAVRNLALENDHVMFSGRFGGVAHEIFVPMDAVLGIVTRENGEGMWFPREAGPEGEPEPPGPPGAPESPPAGGGPKLKVVK